MIQFTDDISQNIELLRHLVSDLPPQRKAHAQSTGNTVMRVVEDLQRAHPKDTATILGIALAAAHILQQLTQGRAATDPADSPQIELLS
jgi:hypothetical protein